MYQLMYNNVIGEYYVNQWTADELKRWQSSGYRLQEGHYREVALCLGESELEKQIRQLAGGTVYAVFENRAAGEVFVSEENGVSGNWRGSKHGHFSLVGEHATQESAEGDAQSRREYFASLASQ